MFFQWLILYLPLSHLCFLPFFFAQPLCYFFFLWVYIVIYQGKHAGKYIELGFSIKDQNSYYFVSKEQILLEIKSFWYQEFLRKKMFLGIKLEFSFRVHEYFLLHIKTWVPTTVNCWKKEKTFSLNEIIE